MKTTQIIKSQFLDLIHNYRTYFIIALPLIIYYPIDVYFFYDYDFFTYGSGVGFIINVFLSSIVIINTHRFVILGENTNFYNLNFKIKLMITYFLFGLFLMFISIAPISFAVYLLELSDKIENDIGLIIGIVFFIFLIISLICFIIVYPFFAFALPKIAVGEQFKTLDVWRESKGYRLTIFLQIIYIFAPLLVFLMFYEGLINDYIIQYIFIPLEILAISCLSKTYLLWKESQNI